MRYWCFISLFLSLSIAGIARTIRVGGESLFNTITEAVAAAEDGDTIQVAKGNYKEKNLVVDKRIVLMGIQYPVLDGEKKYQVITVKANGVSVQGFRIINSGSSDLDEIAAVKLINCRDVVIRDNILDENFFGIYASFVTNSLIEKNTIHSYALSELQSGNGIHCWKSDSMQIVANDISGHRDGIYFEFVTHSVIWRNISHNNIRYGLHFMFSNNDAYVSNVFSQNESGVAVMFSKQVKMFHNFFEENWGDAAYGLLLKEISDSYIDGNHFTKNTSGIYMEGTSRILVSRNQFKQNGWAMKIQASCMDNYIQWNDFSMNTFDVGTNGSLVLNYFDRNYWDKYEGYDLNKDRIGDVSYRPVSLYAMIVEKNNSAMMLFRSFMASLLDKSEKIIPTLTPENLKDNHPLMKPYSL